MYCGLDLSYVGSGVVVLSQNREIVHQRLVTSSSKLSVEERILFLEKEILSPCVLECKRVGIEGLSFGSTSQATSELGALHYYIRLKLLGKCIPYDIVAPTILKKFVTGRGNVSKNIMLKEVYKKWGIDFNNDNICDAYSLAMFVLEKSENQGK